MPDSKAPAPTVPKPPLPPSDPNALVGTGNADPRFTGPSGTMIENPQGVIFHTPAEDTVNNVEVNTTDPKVPGIKKQK